MKKKILSKRGRRPQPVHGQPDAVLSKTSSQKFTENTKSDKVLSKIGKRLLEVRKALGIHQKEMAEKVGMQSSYLCDLESGKKNNPGIVQLYRIAKQYGVSLDYLVLGEGEMFLPGKESEEKKLVEFIPSFEGLDDLTWLLDNSNFSRNLMLSQSSKLYFDNEEFIKKEIKRLRGLIEKPTPGTDKE